MIPDRDIEAFEKFVIFRDEKGNYNLYNKYDIKKNSDGTYTVNVLGTYTEKTFFKLKNAVTWCSFNKRRLIREATRIHQLDKFISSVDTQIHHYTQLIKKSKNVENKIIYLSKLTEDKAKKSMLTADLNNYIQAFQQWQTKAFDTRLTY